MAPIGPAQFRAQGIPEAKAKEYLFQQRNMRFNDSREMLVARHKETDKEVAVLRQVQRGDFNGDGSEDAAIAFEINDGEKRALLAGIIYDVRTAGKTTTLHLLKDFGTQQAVNIESWNDLVAMNADFVGLAANIYAHEQTPFIRADHVGSITLSTGDADGDGDVDVMISTHLLGCHEERDCSRYTLYVNDGPSLEPVYVPSGGCGAHVGAKP